MIKIIGLGPGAKEALTIGALETLNNSPKIYLRTEKHPTVEYLKNKNIKFESYDNKYEEGESFEQVYKAIADDLIKRCEEFKNIVYAVPGHPLVAERSVNILLDLCEKKHIETEIIPAVSFIDALMESLKIDPIEGVKIIDAFDIKNQILDKRVGTIITQVYDKFIASEVKLGLMDYYKDDCEIYFVRAAGVKGLESIRKIPLYELDRQEDIDYLTSIYILRDLDSTKDFRDLLDIMEKLRDSDGCPWDKEQTHESLKRYLIEESYEVLEAIDEKDDDKLSEELGDVLLQVVFHAQIGREDGFFNINDVIEKVCTKMITRHPHVFGNINVDTSDQVLVNWDKIKKKEQGLQSYTDELKHVAKNLPALMRAEKVQKKAAKVGFDWDKIEDALDKVLEEYYEVKDVYKSKEMAKIVEEIGDLIFASVNVARFLDIDPEFALNYTIEKFIKRFAYIEEIAKSKGVDMTNMTLEQMDMLWEEAKNK
ncbi:nucleoside triphosphate pyrophosphohydrolase [Clostridiaceae bacterium UIB06]|uniref:Nucleoside triphosphate pyrophosphohydrolase n=1 Tax=Clostridium thailandense TaxID=2794346 RepID=A0A949WY69_9CLOT|nr:nucleoside triphosphate pyrophosphohydrolase [Clostridium thailandense]MBV7276772.1 nucleoside triphosphate pyrophosphohydrolase [Clostridium thailandense]MCH5137351.1 nucleoside triphosphate pyrophosphohydrolase [Clostridiaceae bacterium UIB06]